MKSHIPIVAAVILVVAAAVLLTYSGDGSDPYVDAVWDGGIQSVTGTGSYAPGEVAELEADLREGYIFDGWYGPDGSYLCETLMLCIDASDIRVEARTVPDSAVTVRVDADYGIASVSGDHRYLPGADVVLEASVKPGFSFVGWFGTDGKQISEVPVIALKAADITVRAVTNSDEPTTVELRPDRGISSAEGYGEYTLGEEVVLTASVSEGYLFDGWYEDGDLLGTDTELRINADGQCIDVRSYLPREVELKLKQDRGVASVTGAGVYGTNETVTVTAELVDGYSFLGWYTSDGIRYSPDLTAEVRIGDRDIVLKASTAYGFSYFPIGMAGTTAYGHKEYGDGMYAFVYASGADPDRFRGWFDLDGRLISRDVQYTPEACDTVLIAKMDDRYHHGDNVLIIEEFPEWYDSHCYCIVTEYHSNSYVTSFRGFDQALVSVIPGVYEFTFYNGLHDDSMVYSRERVTVDGEMEHLLSWNFEGKHYDETWTFDPDIYADYALLNVDRSPGHDDVQRFFEYGKEPVTGLAETIRGYTAGMTEAERAGFVLEFVHCVISYQSDKAFVGEEEWWKYPYETLSDHRGDCEDSSILYGSIMKALGYDTVFLIVYNDMEVHAAIGVNIEGLEGDCVEYGGKEYLYCETTGVYWKVGERPPGYDREIVIPVE